MTEFSASVPIGGVKVGVEYDLSGLDKGEAELKRRVAKGVKVMAAAPQMAPTAQMAFQAAMGGQVARRGAGGGGQPGFLQQPVNWRMGGHGGLLTVFGMARTAEAMMDFGSSDIQASRDLKAAINNEMAIKAMLQSRKAAESAVSQIPFAGSLGISMRRLADSLHGNSQADIDRENAEADRTRVYSQERSDRATEHRVAAARNAAASARLFMGPGGSMAANLAEIEEQRKATEKKLSDAADIDLKKYQLPDKPTLRGDDKLSKWVYEQNMADWKSQNPTAMYGGREVSMEQAKQMRERDQQIGDSNRQFSIQKWEQLLGGRSAAQEINPFDTALGAGAVRTDGSLSGQDPEVITILSRIADNTMNLGPPAVGR